MIAGTCDAIDPPTSGRADGHLVVCHLYDEQEAQVG
jgi:hypothetical protein